ncbi:MAG: PAS domain-containing sensor histidine kinase [Stappiaceae bacterium]
MKSVLRNFEYIASVRRFLDGLVHPSVAGDDVAFAKHRSFIFANLAGGALAFLAFPIYLIGGGIFSFAHTTIFTWLALQMPLAMYLSRYSNLQTAYTLAALLFSLFIGTLLILTGGMSSFAVLWLMIIPLEAALSSSKRVIAASLVFAAVTLGVVSLVGYLGALPTPLPLTVGMISSKSLAASAALIYASIIGLRLEWERQGLAEISRRQKARYQMVTESVSDIISLHSENSDIVFITPSSEKILGIKTEEALGNGFFQHVHIADRPAFLTAIADAGSRLCERRVEFRAQPNALIGRAMQHAQGNGRGYVWLEMICRPLLEPDPINPDAKVIAITRDISAHKAQERELQAAWETAEAASQAKSRFLANISHELRTPLNAVIGFSDLMQNSPQMFGNDERGIEYVGLINDSGKHLLQVVNDLLDVSKIESGTMQLEAEAFDLAASIEHCGRLLAELAKQKGVSIDVNVPDPFPDAIADPRACKQILLNLLSNAIKFSRKGSVVQVGAKRKAKSVVISVKDEGIGIDSAHVDKLCGAFFQTDSGYDRDHEGTGLGLSVVKGLVQLHGGTIDIDSKLGVGTCVFVTLPDQELNITQLDDVRSIPEVAVASPEPDADIRSNVTTMDAARKSRRRAI